MSNQDIIIKENEKHRNQAELLLYLLTQILDYTCLHSVEGHEKITEELLKSDFDYASANFLIQIQKDIKGYYRAFFALCKGCTIIIPKDDKLIAGVKVDNSFSLDLEELEKSNRWYQFHDCLDQEYQDSIVFNNFTRQETAVVQMKIFLFLVDYLVSSQDGLYSVMENFIKKKQAITKALFKNGVLVNLQTSLERELEQPLDKKS